LNISSADVYTLKVLASPLYVYASAMHTRWPLIRGTFDVAHSFRRVPAKKERRRSRRGDPEDALEGAVIAHNLLNLNYKRSRERDFNLKDGGWLRLISNVRKTAASGEPDLRKASTASFTIHF